MKNIGILTHNFPYNLNDRQNAGIFVNDISQEIAKREKIFIFAPFEGGRENRIGRVKVTNFPVLKGKKLGDLKFWNLLDIIKFISFFVGGLYSLQGFIKKNKISVNVAMWSFPSGAFSYFAKKFYGTPYLTWCLGSDIYIYAKIPVLKNVIRMILRSSNFVFADGIDLAKQVENLSGRQCIFLPSVSNASYKKGLNQKRKKTKIVLTFVGRMEEIKGPDILLKSLIRIKGMVSKFEIHFIGGGSLVGILKGKVAKNGMGKEIFFHGNVNRFQLISDIIRRSDWLIIPSRSDSIPLVFSEAMKCGTPVIAANLPDLSYFVKKYKVGYLFQRGNSNSLARVLKKLPTLKKRQKLFSNNTKLVSKVFDVSVSASRLHGFIERLRWNQPE